MVIAVADGAAMEAFFDVHQVPGHADASRPGVVNSSRSRRALHRRLILTRLIGLAGTRSEAPKRLPSPSQVIANKACSRELSLVFGGDAIPRRLA